MYNSLIQPYLCYGLVVWGETSITNLEKSLRLCFFSCNPEHAMLLFLQSSIFPIDMLICKSVGVLMHDIDHDFVPLKLMNLG